MQCCMAAFLPHESRELSRETHMTKTFNQRPTDRHATGMSCYLQGIGALAKVWPFSGRTTE